MMMTPKDTNGAAQANMDKMMGSYSAMGINGADLNKTAQNNLGL